MKNSHISGINNFKKAKGERQEESLKEDRQNEYISGSRKQLEICHTSGCCFRYNEYTITNIQYMCVRLLLNT